MSEILISNLVIAFVTGVISSFGHCLGMCGGIVAIYSARQPALITVGDTHPRSRIVAMSFCEPRS